MIYSEPSPGSDRTSWERARKLHKALKGARMIQARMTILAWALSMGRLKKESCPREIDAVLEWYCNNLGRAGTDGIPRVCSAESFRARFSELSRAMHRDKEAGCVVSDNHKRKAAELADLLPFPAEIRAALPQLVAVSEQRTVRFIERIGRFCEASGPGRELSFLVWLLERELRTLLDDWFTLLSNQHGWKECYTGRPLDLAFDPAAPLFGQSLWQRWSEEYSGDWRAFGPLLKELNKEG